jgi:hypothetical protein
MYYINGYITKKMIKLTTSKKYWKECTILMALQLQKKIQ